MRAVPVLLALAFAAAGLSAAQAGRRAAGRTAGAGPGAARRLARAIAAFDAAGTGAVSRIPVPEPDLFAFRVAGRLRRADLRAMARLLGAAFAARGRIDVLIALPELDGIDPGALTEPEALGAMLRSNLHVRRYAVVCPPAWAGRAIRALDPLSPVSARTFTLAQEPAAWAWVRGGTGAEGP